MQTPKGDKDLVLLGAVRVAVTEEGGHWFAQGIEIDYAAAGNTLEDVQRRFERGLAATVRAHVARFGTIEKLLKVAPQSAWSDEYGRMFRFTQVLTCHRMEELEDVNIPFKVVSYLEVAKAA